MVRTNYVSITADNSKVICAGMINNLETRVYQHKNKPKDGFNKKYNSYKQVWYDETEDVVTAIEIGKSINGRIRKIRSL